MKSTRVKFDDTYYTIEAIKRSEKFRILKNNLLNRYSLPLEGFKHLEDYRKWQTKLLKQDVLPLDILKEVLEYFNLDPKDEKLRLGLKWVLFFNQVQLTKSPINYLPGITKDGRVEMSLTIEPWATKEDFENLEVWKTVEQYRREFAKTKKSKNKPWETFERDLEIYTLYQQAQHDITSSRTKTLTPHRLLPTKSVYDLLKTYDKYAELENEYENLEDELRAIISRCKKTFGTLQIL